MRPESAAPQRPGELDDTRLVAYARVRMPCSVKFVATIETSSES
jgi:hypothetical protein